MSLINDALKRARLSRKKKDDATSQDSPLEPVEPSDPPKSANSGDEKKRSPRILLLAVVLLCCAGVWFVWKWWTSPAQPPPQLAVQSGASNETPGEETSALPTSAGVQTSVVENVEGAANEVDTVVAEVSGDLAETNAIVAATMTGSEPDVPALETNAPEIAEFEAPAPIEEPLNLQPARPVTFPELKLQGIFFRLSNPSALINNRTLFVGSKVEGVTVEEIQRYKVILELNGARKELFLK